MSNLYTINGTVIPVGGEPTTEQVKSAMISAIASGDINLGSVVGATLAYTSPGTAWETNAQTAYNNMLTVCRTIPNTAIPFFVSTDQHSAGLEQHRWLNNADVDDMEIMSINLGDSVNDTYYPDHLSYIAQRTEQVKNFMSVPGNHDYKYGSVEVSRYDLTRWFMSTRDRRMIENPCDCYAVRDNAHNVKYIAVDPYDDAGIRSGMPHPYINADVAEWLIAEMSEDDGYDIVVCIHEPPFTSCQNRNETAESAYSAGYNLRELLTARKNGASGTYTDSAGNSHTYNFSGLTGDMLCTLSGHVHEELYSVSDGLTSYACNWYGDNKCCTFGLIDRENSLLRIFRFDSTAVYDELQIAI